jgi:hypothetical protein
VKRDHDKIATEALLIGLSVTTSIRNEIRAIPREALSAKLSKPKRFFLQSIKKTFFCIVTGEKTFLHVLRAWPWRKRSPANFALKSSGDILACHVFSTQFSVG